MRDEREKWFVCVNEIRFKCKQKRNRWDAWTKLESCSIEAKSLESFIFAYIYFSLLCFRLCFLVSSPVPPFVRLVRRFACAPFYFPLLKIKCSFDFRCRPRSVRLTARQSGQKSAMQPRGDRLGSIKILELVGNPVGKALGVLTSTESETGNDANSCANTERYQLNLNEKTIGRTALTKDTNMGNSRAIFVLAKATKVIGFSSPRLHRSNRKLCRVELQICSRSLPKYRSLYQR